MKEIVINQKERGGGGIRPVKKLPVQLKFMYKRNYDTINKRKYDSLQ